MRDGASVFFIPVAVSTPAACCCTIPSRQKIAGNESVFTPIPAVLYFYAATDPAHNHHVNNQFNSFCPGVSPAPMPIYLHPVKTLTALIIYLYPGLMTKRNTAP